MTHPERHDSFGTFPRDFTSQRYLLYFGMILGAVFGLWNLLATWFDPLAEDSPAALLVFYGPMFTIWGIAGFVVSRRSGRALDGFRAGATIAFATFVVYIVTQFVRVNMFLDILTQRSDWQNLMATFQSSGSQSLRRYVNYLGLAGAPFKILVASIIGAVTGFVGGSLGAFSRQQPRPAPQ